MRSLRGSSSTVKAEVCAHESDDDELSHGSASAAGPANGAGAGGNRSDQQPLFLRKTYQMLETCPQAIACWSEAGDSFMIKDPDRFAADVIPQYFSHNNFSSFVRQLNFYGFRKVKQDVRIPVSQATTKWWEFRHDKFLRGKPHLLSQIRRATHGANNEQEVSHLKSEVGQLKDRVQEMSCSIDRLVSLVNDLMLDKVERAPLSQQLQPLASPQQDAAKKRKTRASSRASSAAAAVPPSLDGLEAISRSLRQQRLHGQAEEDEEEEKEEGEGVTVKAEAAVMGGGDGVGTFPELGLGGADDPLLGGLFTASVGVGAGSVGGGDVDFPLASYLNQPMETSPPTSPRLECGGGGGGGLRSGNPASMFSSPPRPSTPHDEEQVPGRAAAAPQLAGGAAASSLSSAQAFQQQPSPSASTSATAASSKPLDEMDFACLQQSLTSLSAEHKKRLVETLVVALGTSSSSSASSTVSAAALMPAAPAPPALVPMVRSQSGGGGGSPSSSPSSADTVPPPPPPLPAATAQAPSTLKAGGGAAGPLAASAAFGAFLTQYAKELQQAHEPKPHAMVGHHHARKAIRSQG